MKNILICFTSIITVVALITMFLKKSLLALLITLSGLFVSAVLYIFFQQRQQQPISLLPILAPNAIYEEFPRTLRPHG